MPLAATWMDLEIIIVRDYYSKWSKSKTNIWCRLCVESIKRDTDELIYKTEIDTQT